MKHFLPILFILVTAACSCGTKDPTPSPAGTLSFNPETISVSTEACTRTVAVTADCDWGVSSDDKSWVTVSPSGGVAGKSEVTVTIAENKSYDERATNVVFRYGSEKKELAVTQQAVEKPAVDPSIKVPEGYSLVWHDEFDEEPVASGNWKFENWAPGRVNNELQRYVPGGERNGKKTAFVKDGVLNIVAQKDAGEVISARMNSTSAWKYGWVEARIKLPKGKGTWPAFWMMPSDFSLGWPACGEIDIMEEVGVNPNQTSSSIHTKSYNHVINTQKTKERNTAGAEDDFHVYAMEWTPEGMYAYVDGIHDSTTLTFLNDGKGNNDTWPFNKEFYIILNLAWGGDWGGWNGVNEAALPCTMQVDYVRVFQKN